MNLFVTCTMTDTMMLAGVGFYKRYTLFSNGKKTLIFLNQKDLDAVILRTLPSFKSMLDTWTPSLI
jgi:hypothetical protein